MPTSGAIHLPGLIETVWPERNLRPPVQIRRVIALYLASCPDLSLGPLRAQLPNLAWHLRKHHRDLWLNPAHCWPKIKQLLLSPESMGAFVCLEDEEGREVVQLITSALRRASHASRLAAREQAGPSQSAQPPAAPAAPPRLPQPAATAPPPPRAPPQNAAGTQLASGAISPLASGGHLAARRGGAPPHHALPTAQPAAARSAATVAPPSAPAAAASAPSQRAPGPAPSSATAPAAAAATVALAVPDDAHLHSLQRLVRLALARDPRFDEKRVRLLRAAAFWLTASPQPKLGPHSALMASVGVHLSQQYAGFWNDPDFPRPGLRALLTDSAGRDIFRIAVPEGGKAEVVSLDLEALHRAAAAVVRVKSSSPSPAAAAAQTAAALAPAPKPARTPASAPVRARTEGSGLQPAPATAATATAMAAAPTAPLPAFQGIPESDSQGSPTADVLRVAAAAAAAWPGADAASRLRRGVAQLLATVTTAGVEGEPHTMLMARMGELLSRTEAAALAEWRAAGPRSAKLRTLLDESAATAAAGDEEARPSGLHGGGVGGGGDATRRPYLCVVPGRYDAVVRLDLQALLHDAAAVWKGAAIAVGAVAKPKRMRELEGGAHRAAPPVPASPSLDVPAPASLAPPPVRDASQAVGITEQAEAAAAAAWPGADAASRLRRRAAVILAGVTRNAELGGEAHALMMNAMGHQLKLAEPDALAEWRASAANQTAKKLQTLLDEGGAGGADSGGGGALRVPYLRVVHEGPQPVVSLDLQALLRGAASTAATAVTTRTTATAAAASKATAMAAATALGAATVQTSEAAAAEAEANLSSTRPKRRRSGDGGARGARLSSSGSSASAATAARVLTMTAPEAVVPKAVAIPGSAGSEPPVAASNGGSCSVAVGGGAPGISGTWAQRLRASGGAAASSCPDACSLSASAAVAASDGTGFVVGGSGGSGGGALRKASLEGAAVLPSPLSSPPLTATTTAGTTGAAAQTRTIAAGALLRLGPGPGSGLAADDGTAGPPAAAAASTAGRGAHAAGPDAGPGAGPGDTAESPSPEAPLSQVVQVAIERQWAGADTVSALKRVAALALAAVADGPLGPWSLPWAKVVVHLRKAVPDALKRLVSQSPPGRPINRKTALRDILDESDSPRGGGGFLRAVPSRHDYVVQLDMPALLRTALDRRIAARWLKLDGNKRQELPPAAAAAATTAGAVKRCVLRLLATAPPPHQLSLSKLGIEVPKMLGDGKRLGSKLRQLCEEDPGVFEVSLQGKSTSVVRLIHSTLIAGADALAEAEAAAARSNGGAWADGGGGDGGGGGGLDPQPPAGGGSSGSTAEAAASAAAAESPQSLRVAPEADARGAQLVSDLVMDSLAASVRAGVLAVPEPQGPGEAPHEDAATQPLPHFGSWENLVGGSERRETGSGIGSGSGNVAAAEVPATVATLEAVEAAAAEVEEVEATKPARTLRIPIPVPVPVPVPVAPAEKDQGAEPYTSGDPAAPESDPTAVQAQLVAEAAAAQKGWLLGFKHPHGEPRAWAASPPLCATVQVVVDPYSSEAAVMLGHCRACTQVGLTVQTYGDEPVLVALYAPATVGSDGGDGDWPAAVVYLVDCAACTALYGGDAFGRQLAGVLLASLRSLLEDPAVTKVVHGCGQIHCLETACGGAVTTPLVDTRGLLAGMAFMLGLPPAPLTPSAGAAGGPHGSPLHDPLYALRAGLSAVHDHVGQLYDALQGTGLWADQPGLLESLALRHYAGLRREMLAAAAATEEAESRSHGGADGSGAGGGRGLAAAAAAAEALCLLRPLDDVQLAAVAGCTTALPELWMAMVEEAVLWVAVHAPISEMRRRRGEAAAVAEAAAAAAQAALPGDG